MWASCQEPDPEIKISRSHYKILSKLTEICWRWLSMTSSYSVQSSIARPIRGSHVKSRTLELKSCVHTIKLTKTCWRWLCINGSYSVQSSVARPTRGPHVKSRTLELKSHVHTIKFNRNGPKFFEMIQYNWQLLYAKQCDKIYIIYFFWETGSYWVVTIVWLIVITLWAQMFGLDWCVWWWFGMEWVHIIFLMRMGWCRYNLVSNPFAAWGLLGSNPRVYTIEAPKHIAQKPTTSTFEPKPTNLKPNHTTSGATAQIDRISEPVVWKRKATGRVGRTHSTAPASCTGREPNQEKLTGG